MYIRLFFISISFFILSSCATSYTPIHPTSVNYGSSLEKDNVLLEYQYGGLKKNYFKKGYRNGIKVVAVKITNLSHKDLIFGDDVVLTYSNGVEVEVMDNYRAYQYLRQDAETNLLFLLLTPIKLFISSGFNQKEFPIGYVAGPGLSFINFGVGQTANMKFKKEMLTYNINHHSIPTGSTVYGLVPIKSEAWDALSLKVKSK